MWIFFKIFILNKGKKDLHINCKLLAVKWAHFINFCKINIIGYYKKELIKKRQVNTWDSYFILFLRTLSIN